jgi:hypothetical protein
MTDRPPPDRNVVGSSLPFESVRTGKHRKRQTCRSREDDAIQGRELEGITWLTYSWAVQRSLRSGQATIVDGTRQGYIIQSSASSQSGRVTGNPNVIATQIKSLSMALKGSRRASKRSAATPDMAVNGSSKARLKRRAGELWERQSTQLACKI